MKVILAFRESKGTIADKAIAWWTSSKYTHIEIIVGDKWISSGPTHGGVYIQELRPLKDTWTYVEVDIDGRVQNTVHKFIQEQIGKKYDWAGILWNQIFITKREDNQDKWFCSEIVAEILIRFKAKELNKDKDSVQYSPGDLWLIYGDTK